MGQGLYSYEIRNKDGVAVLAAVGETTCENYQAVVPRFLADARVHGARRPVVDHREFTGWASNEARSLLFVGWMDIRSQFDQIAVICHDGIRHGMTRFVELVQVTGKDARIFSPRQHPAAFEWLKNDRAANVNVSSPRSCSARNGWSFSE